MNNAIFLKIVGRIIETPIGVLFIDHLLIDSDLKNKLIYFRKINRISNELKTEMPDSFPVTCRTNISGTCNIRCNFCEIHYFYSHAKNHSGNIYPNYLTVKNLGSMNDLLIGLSTFAFATGVGEPLINPYFCDLINFFHKNHPHISLSMTTNAVKLNDEISNCILKSDNFDSISCSIHGGNEETYSELQGNQFTKVISNVEKFVQLRNKKRKKVPKVFINFCLNKKNAESLIPLLYIAKRIGIDGFFLYHYYQSRNKLVNDISFFSDSSDGNKFIMNAYKTAEKLHLTIYPEKPMLIEETSCDSFQNEDSPCYAPWHNIQFPPCLEYENKHLVGVCNRINLLRINFEKWGKSYQFIDIWHHPTLQYLRITVNTSEKNPVCRFCKSADTSQIRCLDPEEYSRRRDKAIRDFFKEMNAYFTDLPQIEGIELLDSNPYEYV